MRGHLNDLDTLLAVNQVNRGKEILATLDAQIGLRPDGDHLNAEISGHLGRVFALVAAKDRRGSNSWLGEGTFSGLHFAQVAVFGSIAA